MKYVAIDIETTGLDPERDQILQLALVVEDTKTPDVPIGELPFFEGLVRHDRISGQAFALAMNVGIIKALAKVGTSFAEAALRGRRVKIYSDVELLAVAAIDFLDSKVSQPTGRRDCVAAGKNAAGFDLPFLPEKLRSCFHHRVIDVGSVALGATPGYWNKPRLPGLSELLEVIHDPDGHRDVTHDALEDARDVVRLLRWVTKGYRGDSDA